MKASCTPFLKLVHDPDGRLSATMENLRQALAGGRGKVALAIAGSEISDLPGMSAAGADGRLRRMTPAVDAEALVLGYPLTGGSLPVSPEGIVSPVVASRAMLSLLGCPVEIFDCGTFVPPQVPAVRVGDTPGRRPDSGAALTYAQAKALFQAGQEHGERLALGCDYLVVAECVPGGTTSALGVLTALGHQAAALVSSSMMTIDRARRARLVERGLAKAAIHAVVEQDPLHAVAAVGDPMQPFSCGVAWAAARRVPVVLAGGTQMLAVYALGSAITSDWHRRDLCVITTKWVAFDPAADAGGLAKLVQAPFAASCPEFRQSRHGGLQAYEQGNVKEGVGLGAMLALAYLSGFQPEAIIQAIDGHYDMMLPAPNTRALSDSVRFP